MSYSAKYILQVFLSLAVLLAAATWTAASAKAYFVSPDLIQSIIAK